MRVKSRLLNVTMTTLARGAVAGRAPCAAGTGTDMIACTVRGGSLIGRRDSGARSRSAGRRQSRPAAGGPAGGSVEMAAAWVMFRSQPALAQQRGEHHVVVEIIPRDLP